MEKKFAALLTYLLHPLLLPGYSFVLMLHMESIVPTLIPLKTKWMVIAFVFLLAAVLPSLINFVFLKRGLIRSMKLENRQERYLPFLVTAGCFYLVATMVKQLELPAVFYLFALGTTMLPLMALFMTFYTKVSVHMIGIGGMTGTFLGLAIRWELAIIPLIMVLFILSGLLAYSRLRLRAHTQAEVYSGYIMGFGVMLLLFLLI